MTAAEQTAVSGDPSVMRVCACQHFAGAHADLGPCQAHDCPCPQFDRVYSLPDVVNLSGATYRQVSYWVRIGLLDDNRAIPDQPKSPDRWHHGSGYPHWFTDYQLAVVRLAAALVAFGLIPSRAFEIAREAVQADRFSTVVADVFELSVTVRRTLPDPTERTTP